MNQSNYDSIVVLGPTATGKTSLAVRLALAFRGEVLSADSRQVYRGLNIGSGKDLCEFTVKTASGGVQNVPYHLIDIADLTQEYSVFDYQRDFYRAFTDVSSRGMIPVIAGGTGMYLDAVIRGYDLVKVPTNIELRLSLNEKTDSELTEILASIKGNLHNSTDTTERHRLLRAIEIAEYEKSHKSEAERAKTQKPSIKPYILALTFPRDVLRKRITARLRARLKEGMIDEVESLHKNGAPWERLERLGLEYRFCSEFLQGKIKTYDEFFTSLNIAIGQFAKRQETWFRSMQKKGVCLNLIPTTAESSADDVFDSALTLLKSGGFCNDARQ